MRLFILTKIGNYVKIEITVCRTTLYFKLGDFSCQIFDARFIFLRYFVYLFHRIRYLFRAARDFVHTVGGFPRYVGKLLHFAADLSTADEHFRRSSFHFVGHVVNLRYRIEHTAAVRALFGDGFDDRIFFVMVTARKNRNVIEGAFFIAISSSHFKTYSVSRQSILLFFIYLQASDRALTEHETVDKRRGKAADAEKKIY